MFAIFVVPKKVGSCSTSCFVSRCSALGKPPPSRNNNIIMIDHTVQYYGWSQLEPVLEIVILNNLFTVYLDYLISIIHSIQESTVSTVDMLLLATS